MQRPPAVALLAAIAVALAGCASSPAMSPVHGGPVTDRSSARHLLAAPQAQVVAYSPTNVRICPPYANGLVARRPPQPPYCRNGLRAVGVDVSALKTHVKGHPERWGLLHLVGFYRNGTFHVLSQGHWRVAPNPPSSFGAPVPCRAPAGGWRLVTPTQRQRWTIDHYYTLTHHRDLVSISFFDQGSVLVVASTDPARTRVELAPYWPRQVCVVRARYSRRFVNRVRARVLSLMQPASRAARYGWVTGAGGYGVNDRGQTTISLQVLIVTPALRAFLRRQPRGIVSVESSFTPAR